MELTHTWLGKGITYKQGLEIQQRAVESILSGEGSNQLFTLEHEPIYTIGRTRDRSSLGENTAMLPHPVVEINRGGQATYHGPGQLSGCPVVDMRPLGKDLHIYIRNLEQALILTCADYGLDATLRDGLTGVWVEERKLASIGVGVKKWIAMHGYAINITHESLRGFQSITPCGLSGVSVTSLESECGITVNSEEFAEKCYHHLKHALKTMMQ